ncbi:hypothetical protein, conserved [Leishmania tarentolae]|uniref:Transmembrane protein n=1 Tax=Leishmania tarentolae TaxID=5689 RepID=A0A640K9T5_LEITA|nr:hypothetical protein, conserved [Leishmania tarentolae]
MSSHDKPHKCGGPQVPQADAEHPQQQQPCVGVTDDTPTREPRSTTGIMQRSSPVNRGDTDDDSYMSVWTDEEDSYRVGIEHDEHLERIRAYTDFHDTLACMRGVADGKVNSESDVTPKRTFDTSFTSTSLTSPEVPPETRARITSSQQQQHQNTTQGEGPWPISLVRMGRGAPQSSCTNGHGASPFVSHKAADANELSRLQAENAQMAVALQASQEAVQRLQESLLEAREALLHRVPLEGENDVVDQAVSDTQQHSFLAATGACEAAAQDTTAGQPPLAVPDTAFSLSNPKSSAHGTSVRTTASAGRRHLTPSELLQRATDRIGDGGVGALFPRSSTQQLDVAEFFWALQVAPPPSTLQGGCVYSDHCQASAVSVCRPPEAADEGITLSGAYGATDRPVEWVSSASAETLQPQQDAETEAAVLACESAWLNSDYYCYHIKEEMSSLRVVSSTDEVVDGSSPAVPAMNNEKVIRRLPQHTPAPTSLTSTPSAEDNTQLPCLNSHSTPATRAPWSVLDGTVTSAWSAAKTRSAVMLPGIVSSPAARCYRLPYLQRLWVTSVLRHLLLFFLVTLICVLLFIPGVVLATVNVFEAAEGEDFYALHNRFGRSAMLVAARSGACMFVCFAFFSALCMSSDQQQQVSPSVDAQREDAKKAASATTAAKQKRRSIFSVKLVGTLVHLMLCSGTGLMFWGTVLLRDGCRHANLSLALLGESFYGAGEALLLGGLGAVVSAEVGVTAGVIVSMQILLLSWLIVNAFGFFVLPSLNYYVYTTASILEALVYVNGFVCALVGSIVMLCPRDLIKRAAQASAKDITRRKLWSAARHDVSICFFLRALTIGLLTAAVVLLLSCGLAVFIPTQAAATAVAESMKSRELMSTSTGMDSKATEATGSLKANQGSWATHQRHAPTLLFTYALVAMPICFIPRMAALINRWCSVPLLTTLLCGMWIISTGASWAPVLSMEALKSNSGGKKGVTTTTASAVLSWCSGVWLWLAERRFLNPCIDICAIATGIIYTVVVSSLLRSMANAGVQLPVMHPNRWRMAFHERDQKSAAAATRFLSESTPLLDASVQKGCYKNTEAAAMGAVRPDTATSHHAASNNAPTPTRVHTLEESKISAEDMQLSMPLQLRGGPAVMTVLTCTLITLVLLPCVAVMTAVAMLLVSRAESPVYVNRLLTGVTLDEHLIAKSALALVLAAAMLVQWAEVVHRFPPFRRS